MKNIYSKGLILFLSLVVIGTSFSSCKKETDCTAVITVVDAGGTPVSGATIHLYSKADRADLQDETKVSDVAGKANFVFKYEAILNIDAKKDALVNIGDVVKLEPGKTVEKTVTIK